MLIRPDGGEDIEIVSVIMGKLELTKVFQGLYDFEKPQNSIVNTIDRFDLNLS